MHDKQYFSEKTFDFIADLKQNNSREWFNENKSRYEQQIKAPLLSFIGDIGPEFKTFAPHIIADPRPNGGSMFRIYRDMRFSKDKSPYKTHAAAQFRHAAGKDIHAPGYYFHLEPGNCVFGAGIWRPDRDALFNIRSYIDDYQDRWQELKKSSAFAENAEFTGESLKRNPQGFDKVHPLIEDIKRKDFIVIHKPDDAVIISETVMKDYIHWCSSVAPLMTFICDALELDW